MKRCLIQLLDKLTFVNRMSRLIKAARKGPAVKAYRIDRYIDKAYPGTSCSLYELNIGDRLSRRRILPDADLDHIRLQCAVMAIDGCFILIDPTIVRETLGLDSIMTANNYVCGGSFSFLEQAEPFSFCRLARELVSFPVTLFGLSISKYLLRDRL